jgi:hypothetical protein
LNTVQEYRHRGGELMGIFDRKNDKPPQSRPDFSNVRSGGSSHKDLINDADLIYPGQDLKIPGA